MRFICNSNVVVVGEQEDEHGDGGEGGGLLDVNEDGAEVKAEALGDENIEEDDEECKDCDTSSHIDRYKDEDGRGGFEVAHPVGDDDEEGREDGLHRQVAGGASEVVGGDVVHAGGAFFEQHWTFLGEGGDGIEEREEAP
ncbi:hypothetical protein U1Q18_020939 [Sarracenia purpurea var. burkii]